MVDVTTTDVPVSPVPSRPGQRWLARLAFLAAAAATVLVLAEAGVRGSLGLLLVGAGGMAVALAGAWWFLTHSGPVRWLAGALLILAPVIVAVLFARARLVWVVVVFALLWMVAIAAGRRALTVTGGAQGPREHEVPPPRRPYLIMNPKSGGGKVDRFDLAERARELGADVILLQGEAVDVAELARQALREGADLLGVAGGDGTQALVAGVAAEHGVPFMVISAGTRNHFALDLGLDREDPADLPGRAHRRRRTARRPRSHRRPHVRQQRLLRRVRGGRAEPRLPRRQDRHHPRAAARPADWVSRVHSCGCASATPSSRARRPCWSATTRTAPTTSPAWAAGPGWTAAPSACSP